MPIDRVDSQRLMFPTELGSSRLSPRQRPEIAEELTDGRGTGFSRAISAAISEVNELQHASAEKVEAFVRGEDVPLHEVVLAQEEAEISFRLLLEARNRLVRAYQEVLRTPM
jgi:flagellar hook-basal body complex protein FliE